MSPSPYAILSFPRSGSHYLQQLLLSRFGVIATRHHSLVNADNAKYVISIVRNPVDSIASIIALQKHNSLTGNEEEWLRQKYWNQDILFAMVEITEKADIIIDFNELVNHPDLVAEKISSITGLPLFKSNAPIVVRGEPNGGFMPTSKDVEGYDEIHNLVSSYSLSQAVDAYKAVLEKAI
jgi:hypothetical protein